MGLSPPRQFAVRRVSKDAATPPTSTNRCRPEALRTAADDPEAAVARINLDNAPSRRMLDRVRAESPNIIEINVLEIN